MHYAANQWIPGLMSSAHTINGMMIQFIIPSTACQTFPTGLEKSV